MNAKEYLNQVVWLNKIINNKLEQKEKLEALAQKVTVDFSQERVSGGSGTTSSMEDITVKLIDLSYEINEYIDQFVDLKREITNTINRVGDFRYRVILEMRYLNDKDWGSISREIGYDARYTMKLHGRALNIVDEMLKKRH